MVWGKYLFINRLKLNILPKNKTILMPHSEAIFNVIINGSKKGILKNYLFKLGINLS